MAKLPFVMSRSGPTYVTIGGRVYYVSTERGHENQEARLYTMAFVTLCEIF